MHAFECLNRTIEKENNLRIEIIHRMIFGCGISFMPPLIVIDIFVRTSMQLTVVRVLEPRRCRLGVVATTSSLLECEVKHWRKLDCQGLREQFEDDVEYPKCIFSNDKSEYL
jgi:hypothetical protein